MNLVKKSFYTTVGLVFLAQFKIMEAAPATTFLGNDKVTTIKGETATAETAIQRIIGNAMTFLTILAVAYALWGGFNILTAGGDEEKVKTGKTILVQGAIGMIVIYLAGTIVDWVLRAVLA